jgi:flagellar motor switch protein FliM
MPEYPHGASIHLDARLGGATLAVQDLMDLKAGEVLSLDQPIDKPIDLIVNGKLKFEGQVVSNGHNRSLLINQASSV